MAEQYTNVRLVLDKLLRHPLLQDVSLEAAVDYTIDFMRIVGTPTIFENKVVTLPVRYHRAPLPCDYYQMLGVRVADSKKTFHYASDVFHLSPDEDYADFTYKIQGGFIITSLSEGDIEISYEAIVTDSDGFPVIPDNSSFIRALSAYIKKERFTILHDLGKISQHAFAQALQDYAWAVGDCDAEFNRLSLDKAESFYNSCKTLILNRNEHNKGFANTASKEFIKNH